MVKSTIFILLALFTIFGHVTSYLSNGDRDCSPNPQDINRACDPGRNLECQQDRVCRCRSTSTSQLFWISRLDRCAYKVGSLCSADGNDRNLATSQINFNQPNIGFGVGGGNFPLCPPNSFCSQQTGQCTCERGYPSSWDGSECSGALNKQLTSGLSFVSLMLTLVCAKLLFL